MAGEQARRVIDAVRGAHEDERERRVRALLDVDRRVEAYPSRIVIMVSVLVNPCVGSGGAWAASGEASEQHHTASERERSTGTSG
jgi:hypothetical protein